MKQFVLKKQKKTLTCKEATKMVVPYIDGQLGDKDLRQFVGHIKECSECREELETYYIVSNNRVYRLLTTSLILA